MDAPRSLLSALVMMPEASGALHPHDPFCYMLFNSVTFAVFFPITLVLCRAVKLRTRNPLRLLAASYFFGSEGCRAET